MTFDEEMGEIEKGVHAEDQGAFSIYTGLIKHHFPASEQLSGDNIRLMLKVFLQKIIPTFSSPIVFRSVSRSISSSLLGLDLP